MLHQKLDGQQKVVWFVERLTRTAVHGRRELFRALTQLFAAACNRSRNTLSFVRDGLLTLIDRPSSGLIHSNKLRKMNSEEAGEGDDVETRPNNEPVLEPTLCDLANKLRERIGNTLRARTGRLQKKEQETHRTVQLMQQVHTLQLQLQQQQQELRPHSSDLAITDALFSSGVALPTTGLQSPPRTPSVPFEENASSSLLFPSERASSFASSASLLPSQLTQQQPSNAQDQQKLQEPQQRTRSELISSALSSFDIDWNQFLTQN